jgi:hypothetical protein
MHGVRSTDVRSTSRQKDRQKDGVPNAMWGVCGFGGLTAKIVTTTRS